MMKDNMLTFAGVEKTFSSGGRSWRLGPVSFSLQKGESVGIIGRSGSGKSTFLHLAGGIIRPNAGAVTFCGKDINVLSDADLSHFRNKHMGFVFQDFYLISEFTLLENVAMPLILRKMTHRMAFEKARSLIEEVGLLGKEQNLPRELSGGQRQRAAIARALVGDPELLLADEPTGNLDEATGKEIFDLLFHLHKKNNMSLLMVSHDRSIMKKTDRCITIADGTIVF
jgi:lipoprotein-releasing system ATP-binding protein